MFRNIQKNVCTVTLQTSKQLKARLWVKVPKAKSQNVDRFGKIKMYRITWK